MEIEKIIAGMEDFHKMNLVREFPTYKFAENTKTAKEIFKAIWQAVDKTSEFVDLPEYKQIYEWMTDTQHKGLFLMGDKGRGKTNIIAHVLPVLMKIKINKILIPIRAVDIDLENINSLKNKFFLAVDEIGVEPRVSNFGEPFESINKLIDNCESQTKLFFGNTNLSAEELTERYGDRILDRIARICKIIEFKGDSFR